MTTGRHPRRFIPRASGDSIAERVWIKVDKRGPNECWPWFAGKSNGYGNLRWQGGTEYAHRLIYIEAFGPIPPGAEVDHTCHNNTGCRLTNKCPHRACCNPAHLEAVPHQVNASRGTVKDANAERRGPRVTHCVHGHEYTAENSSFAYIKKTGRTQRRCKTCRRRKTKTT